MPLISEPFHILKSIFQEHSRKCKTIAASPRRFCAKILQSIRNREFPSGKDQRSPSSASATVQVIIQYVYQEQALHFPQSVYHLKCGGLPCPSFLVAKNIQKFNNLYKVKVKSHSRVRLFVTPWTVAYQAPLSVEFSRQEYCSGLPFPSSGDLSNPGIEPGSPTL